MPKEEGALAIRSLRQHNFSGSKAGVETTHTTTIRSWKNLWSKIFSFGASDRSQVRIKSQLRMEKHTLHLIKADARWRIGSGAMAPRPT